MLFIRDQRKKILHGNRTAWNFTETKPTPECRVHDSECYDGWVGTVIYMIPIPNLPKSTFTPLKEERRKQVKD